MIIKQKWEFVCYVEWRIFLGVHNYADNKKALLKSYLLVYGYFERSNVIN